MTKKELERKLTKAGWSRAREGGNHTIWTKGGKMLPVHRHKGDIPKGTAQKIMKIAGLK